MRHLTVCGAWQKKQKWQGGAHDRLVPDKSCKGEVTSGNISDMWQKSDKWKAKVTSEKEKWQSDREARMTDLSQTRGQSSAGSPQCVSGQEAEILSLLQPAPNCTLEKSTKQHTGEKHQTAHWRKAPYCTLEKSTILHTGEKHQTAHWRKAPNCTAHKTSQNESTQTPHCPVHSAQCT